MNLQKRLENVHKDEHRLKFEAHMRKKRAYEDNRGPGLYYLKSQETRLPKKEKF